MKTYFDLLELRHCADRKIYFYRKQTVGSRDIAVIYCGCQALMGTCKYGTACRVVRADPLHFEMGVPINTQQERLFV